MIPALQLVGLRKSFGGLLVTDNVSLHLDAGSRHALIGPNGAGKSTLVGLVCGAIQPDAGQVLLFGSDLTRSVMGARVKAGLVRSFQITSLFPKLTAFENVLLAINEKDGVASRLLQNVNSLREQRDRCQQVLEELKLADKANIPVQDMSYGEQRLVEIALVLALRPRVLLLDEPAAGIPSSETGLLLNALSKLPAEMAILMIEHDMKLVREFCMNVTVLVSGRVLASGTATEVMNSDTVRDVYLGRAGLARFVGTSPYV